MIAGQSRQLSGLHGSRGLRVLRGRNGDPPTRATQLHPMEDWSDRMPRSGQAQQPRTSVRQPFPLQWKGERAMESDKGPRLARTVRGQQGWIARATSVGGGLAIMLVLVASAGAGAAAPHRTTLAPPYNATTYSWATSSATGCGSQRTIHPIGFNNSNGL